MMKKGTRNEPESPPQGSSNSSVIAKYIQRFRTAPPSSPHERRRASPERKQRIENDFWWSSSKKTPASPYSGSSHGVAISSPPSVSRRHQSAITTSLAPPADTTTVHPAVSQISSTNLSKAVEITSTTNVEMPVHPTASAHENNGYEIAKAPEADESRLEWSHDISTEELLRAIDITDRQDEENENELMFREDASFRSLEHQSDLPDYYMRHRNELDTEDRNYSYWESTPPRTSRLWDSDMEWLKKARSFIDDSRAKSMADSIDHNHSFEGGSRSSSLGAHPTFKVPSSRLPVLKARVEKFRTNQKDYVSTTNENTASAQQNHVQQETGAFAPSGDSINVSISNAESSIAPHHHPEQARGSEKARKHAPSHVNPDEAISASRYESAATGNVTAKIPGDESRRAELAARYEAVFPSSQAHGTSPVNHQGGTEPNMVKDVSGRQRQGGRSPFGQYSAAFASLGHAFSGATAKETPQLSKRSAPTSYHSFAHDVNNAKQHFDAHTEAGVQLQPSSVTWNGVSNTSSASQAKSMTRPSCFLTVEKTVDCTVEGGTSGPEVRNTSDVSTPISPVSQASHATSGVTSERETTAAFAMDAFVTEGSNDFESPDSESDDSLYVDPSVLAREKAESTIQRLRERLRHARYLENKRYRERQRQIIDTERRPKSYTKIPSKGANLLHSRYTHEAIPPKKQEEKETARLEFCGSVVKQSITPATSTSTLLSHSATSETSLGESMRDSTNMMRTSCLNVQRCEHIHITSSTFSHREVTVRDDRFFSERPSVSSPEQYNQDRYSFSLTMTSTEANRAHLVSVAGNETEESSEIPTYSSSKVGISSAVEEYLSNVSYESQASSRTATVQPGDITSTTPEVADSTETCERAHTRTVSEMVVEGPGVDEDRSCATPAPETSVSSHSRSAEGVDEGACNDESRKASSQTSFEPSQERSEAIATDSLKPSATIDKEDFGQEEATLTHTTDGETGTTPQGASWTESEHEVSRYTCDSRALSPLGMEGFDQSETGASSSISEANETTLVWSSIAEESHLRASAPTSLSASISFDVSSDEESELSPPSKNRKNRQVNTHDAENDRLTEGELQSTEANVEGYSGEESERNEWEYHSRNGKKDTWKEDRTFSPNQTPSLQHDDQVASMYQYPPPTSVPDVSFRAASNPSRSVVTENDFCLVKEGSEGQRSIGGISREASAPACTHAEVSPGQHEATTGAIPSSTLVAQESRAQPGISTPSSITLDFDPVYRSLLERVSQIVPLPEENAFEVDFATWGSSVPSAALADENLNGSGYASQAYEGSSSVPGESCYYGYTSAPLLPEYGAYSQAYDEGISPEQFAWHTDGYNPMPVSAQHHPHSSAWGNAVQPYMYSNLYSYQYPPVDFDVSGR